MQEISYNKLYIYSYASGYNEFNSEDIHNLILYRSQNLYTNGLYFDPIALNGEKSIKRINIMLDSYALEILSNIYLQFIWVETSWTDDAK